MLIPYSVDVPLRTTPIINWLLIAVTVLVSYSLFVSGQASTSFNAIMKGDFHGGALLGYQFTHGGWGHLIGNMMFLFVFGNAVCGRVGNGLYVPLYLALGAVAGLGWWVFASRGEALIGASGAIMGVIGVYIVLFPRNDVSIWYFFFSITGGAGTISISSYWLIGVYVLLDVLGVLSPGNGGVAHLAHLAGLVPGAALAGLLLKAGVIKPLPDEQNLLQIMGLQPKSTRHDRQALIQVRARR